MGFCTNVIYSSFVKVYEHTFTSAALADFWMTLSERSYWLRSLLMARYGHCTGLSPVKKCKKQKSHIMSVLGIKETFGNG